MEKILQIQNLVKQFGQNTVLHGINLEIEKGQVACLIGPSGSGKSTLLRCINLLEMPNGGQVSFRGQDVTTLPTGLLHAKIGMVFQQFNLSATCPPRRTACWGKMKVLKRSRDDSVERARHYLTGWALPFRDARLTSFQADKSSGRPSPGPCPWTRRCCCLMSQPAP